MKILVLSDSHGQIGPMQRAVQAEQPDEIFHLGDHIGDAEQLARLFPSIPVLRVVGNCDSPFSGVPVVQCERQGVRIFATHGHRYHVKFGYLRLKMAAREAQAQVVLFGHTHVPYCEQLSGLWMLNPGASGSYGVIKIENETVTCELHKGGTT